MDNIIFDDKDNYKMEGNKKKTLDLVGSCKEKIKKIDLLGEDIEAAINHGKAQRLLKLDKDLLKKAIGNNLNFK
jgi:hypothetical protein